MYLRDACLANSLCVGQTYGEREQISLIQDFELGSRRMLIKA
jgi:hypothetical protein